MSDTAERPWATQETEDRVAATFPVDMLPEEFAARDGYGWLDFPFSRFRYRNPHLDQWIQQVSEILRDPRRMQACQAKYLSPYELQVVRRYMQDDDESTDDG